MDYSLELYNHNVNEWYNNILYFFLIENFLDYKLRFKIECGSVFLKKLFFFLIIAYELLVKM